MEHKGRAIILRATDFGEADRLVTFFTEELGKFKGVAKHAKRSVRRFGGGLEPGTIANVRFVEKGHAELVRLEDVVVEWPAWKAAGSLPRLMALNVTLELADRMLAPAHASRERFELLQRWIMFLGDNEPHRVHIHAFYYKWLAASGLAPVFDVCVLCRKAQSPAWGISATQGGAVCSDCRRAGVDYVSVEGALLKYLQGFKSGRFSDNASTAIITVADDIFCLLLEHAVGGRLKSLSIVGQVL